MNNITKLIILVILIAAIPITINLVQKQQTIKSRAECPDICVQYGDPPCTGYEQVCTGYEQVCNDWDEDGNCIGWGNGDCNQWGNGDCNQWGDPPCINWQPDPNCQPPPPGGVCTAGSSQYCITQYCPDGSVCADGHQDCLPDESGWGNCQEDVNDCATQCGGGQSPPPEPNYCLEQGYNECAPETIDTVVGECSKDGKICSKWQTYACNFEGKYYCTYACDEPCKNDSCPLSGDNCIYSTSDGSCYSGKTGNTSTCAAGYPPGVCVNPTAGCNYSCGPVTCPIQTGASPSPRASASPRASTSPRPPVSTAPRPSTSAAPRSPAPSSPTSVGGATKIYIDPNPAAPGSKVAMIATGPTSCSQNITFNTGTGLIDCPANYEAITCNGGNPKDSNPCWWKKTCTAGSPGSYTASFNAQGSNCSSTIAYSIGSTASVPPGGGASTVSFKIAENPSDLASAPEQPYTAEPMLINFEFADNTPGTKFIWVEFKDSNNKTKRENVQVKLLGPDPTITSCSLGFEGNVTVLNLAGQNFGTDRGTVKSDTTSLQVREWKNNSVKMGWQNAPEGKEMPVILTNSDGQSATGQCSASSQLALGAKVFCRAPSNHDMDNVDLTLVGLFEGGTRAAQKVKIDKNGIVTGLTQKLEEGKQYKLSVKGRRLLRKASEAFTAGAGTTNIPNFVLPVGDVFPLDGGDGTINALDKSELNRQWNISGDATGRAGDFNRDGKVNSIDWACMRYDFGKSDDAEPIPGPMPTPIPSASLSPSPSPSSSPTSIPQPVAWWKFDEGTGTTANDSSGNNPGTINGASWTAGRNSQALTFNGTSDYVGGVSSASLNEIRSAVTLVAWVKPATTISGWTDRGIISKNNTSESFELTHYSSQADVDAFAGFVSIGGDEKWAIGTTSPVPNTLYHVTLTYDGSQVKIYVNGRLEDSEAATGPIDTNNFNFAIGARNGTTGMRPFQGLIDDARIYNFALTATEISNLYNTALQ